MCRKRGQSLRLNIAVIDNGVNRELLEILLPNKKDTVDCRQILDGVCVPQFLEPEGDLESHGTLCTALLMEFLEKKSYCGLPGIQCFHLKPEPRSGDW